MTEADVERVAKAMHEKQIPGITIFGSWGKQTSIYRGKMCDLSRAAIAAMPPLADKWQPIETAPEHEMILIWVPGQNSGLDSAEVAMFVEVDGDRCWWSNSGPNGGLDFQFEQAHIRWQPLPEPPK